MSTPIRRSTRARKVNPKYVVDRRALSDSESSDSGKDAPDADVNSDVETEFDAASPAQRSPASVDVHDDALSEGGSSVMLPSTDDEFDAANSETPNGTVTEAGEHEAGTKPKTPGVVGRDRGKEWAQNQGLRSRYIDFHLERSKRGAKQQFPLLFGPAEEDLRAVLEAREIWGLMSRDITFPSRISLYREAQSRASQAAITDSARPGVVKSLDTSPTRHRLSAAESKEAKYVVCGPPQDIVTGPWPGHKISKLPAHQVISAGEGYTDKQNKAQSKGWLLNAGSRVQCLAWMPTKSDRQILTIVPTCTSEQRGPAPFQSTNRSPAFSPSTTYPSSIHFWRVPTVLDKPRLANARCVGRPTLVCVACVDWGDIKLIEYNYLKGVATTDDAREVVDLIVLSSDGNVRVFPIAVTQDSEITTYEKVDQVSFLARPAEETVFTTFSLATAEDLAVGASDGTVSMFSLRQTTGVLSSSTKAQPYLTIQVHATYVSSLAFATDLPQFLASQSAGGDLVLIDIRAPHQDRVSCHKTRLPTRSLAYLPFTRAFLTTTDSAGNSESYGTMVSALHSHSLRHFYFGSTIAKLPEASGVITAMATSTAHPCVLVANSQGQVFATNTVRRLLPGSSKDAYLHKLFEYDWQVRQELESEQPPVPATSEQDSSAELYFQPDPRAGMSRLTCGFRPERIEPGPGGSKRAAPYEETAASAQVIFEEEQAVTALAWNTNIDAGHEYGGWAAVAWGSGMVWLGDLGHDAK